MSNDENKQEILNATDNQLITDSKTNDRQNSEELFKSESNMVEQEEETAKKTNSCNLEQVSSQVISNDYINEMEVISKTTATIIKSKESKEELELAKALLEESKECEITRSTMIVILKNEDSKEIKNDQIKQVLTNNVHETSNKFHKSKESSSMKEETLEIKSEEESRHAYNKRDEQASEDDDGNDKSLPLLEQPLTIEGKRERKLTQRLELVQPEVHKVEIPNGRGKELSTLERVSASLDKHTIDELKILYRVCFNSYGKKHEVKKHLRLFKGFDFDQLSNDYLKKKDLLNKNTVASLKVMCEILDLEKSGTKDDLCDRIMNFLLEPRDLNKPVASINKRKSTTSNTSKKKKMKNNKAEAKSDEDDLESNTNTDSTTASAKLIKRKSRKMTPSFKKLKSTSKLSPKNKIKKDQDREDSKDDHVEVNKVDTEKYTSKDLPNDDQIRNTIKEILDGADLEKVTMKTVLKEIEEKYPDVDLSSKRGLIKDVVKEQINISA